jgi:hypothetical protein
MDAQELRSLQEAYLEVVSNNNELSEMSYKKLPVGKMMRKVEYRAEREADTRADAEREANDPHSILNYDRARREHKRAETNKERSNRMINVADTHSKKVAKAKSKLKKEQVDIYDIILSHLLDEGYAETLEAAEAMMVNMSEEWRDSILSEGEKPLPYGRMMKKSNELADSDDKKKRKRAAYIYLAANSPKGPKVKIRK